MISLNTKLKDYIRKIDKVKLKDDEDYIFNDFQDYITHESIDDVQMNDDDILYVRFRQDMPFFYIKKKSLPYLQYTLFELLNEFTEVKKEYQEDELRYYEYGMNVKDAKYRHLLFNGGTINVYKDNRITEDGLRALWQCIKNKEY